MILLDVVFALVIAVVVAALFTWGFGHPGPWGGFLWFVLFLFLATWAIGKWVEPIGPSFWGVVWIPWVVGALLVALLVASIPAADPDAEPPGGAGADQSDAMAALAIGGFFWILLFLLMLAIAAAYL